LVESVHVIGAGRVGSAVSARLAERGIELTDEGAELVLICVPDAAIAEVARALEPGPWVAHVSGATPLAALDPHSRRFGLHPLQSFTRVRGPEQLDGAWGAVTAETDEARALGRELARTLGLHPFDLEDDERTLYHAGAVVAASFLVTLHEAAGELFAAAGAPVEALEPLMTRVIENGFEPTGPFVRRDFDTVERHLDAIRARRPQLQPLYRALADTTETLAVR
jgi:predicted short-subunit dehydrogenase-like oxidoreductase (DUF2520 family)